MEETFIIPFCGDIDFMIIIRIKGNELLSYDIN